MNPDSITPTPLDTLAAVDPEAARIVAEGAAGLPDEALARLVADALWASSLEPSFGRAVARGHLALARAGGSGETLEYRRLVREAGRSGPALGRLLAKHLPPVLGCGRRQLRAEFLEAVGVMRAKGTYTLPYPLEVLSALLAGGEVAAAGVYLDLLRAAFSHDLSYVRCQHFAHALPRAVLSFPAPSRPWQTAQLCRVVRTDPGLADPFLDGMAAGLRLLSEPCLAQFVDRALEKLEGNRKQAAGLLALSSRAGLEAFRRLQVTVSLGEAQARLDRYLQARIGEGVAVRSTDDLPGAFRGGGADTPMTVSDGRCIYLPGRIGACPTRPRNLALYKALARIEAGQIEFGTFDFDLEKMAAPGDAPIVETPGGESGDLRAFFDSFPDPRLAADLFTAFEHGRVRKCLARRYPGLARRCLPLLRGQSPDPGRGVSGEGPLQALYRLAALGESPGRQAAADGAGREVGGVFRRFEQRVTAESGVEDCGRLVVAVYPEMERLCRASGGCRPLSTPFGRRIDPDLAFSRQVAHDRAARRIRAWVREKGYRVYASDIRRRLVAGGGSLSLEELRQMIRAAAPGARAPGPDASGGPELSDLDLSELARDPAAGIVIAEDAPPDEALGCPVFLYDEWDSGVSDYLRDHVRVCQRPVPEASGDFYRQALIRHRGLVRRMRHAFELLRPQGIQILRRWVEGDEFDYRALLDAALDRRAGLIPSDRLYTKRVKQRRDVCVLLLVDLSRSTAGLVKGSGASVLDVEKEAIVLFCEALGVVGDDFSIAGFSGSGRLGVDYFTVKAFAEEMNDAVRGRIAALAPRRATRMGAAIRHATRRLGESPSRVKLLIILGDGFPNDVDYKQAYAVADTRRAVFEAHAREVFTHAITVNIAGDPRLDDLYGPVRHTVIADVRELPDKLLRIYGSLTRH